MKKFGAADWETSSAEHNIVIVVFYSVMKSENFDNFQIIICVLIL